MAIKNLLSIKEFSELSGLKQTTLRYYDDIGLFSPALHSEGGHRYYSPTQILTIHAIQTLKELHMPMNEIIELEKNRTPERFLRMCFDKKMELSVMLRNINRLNDILSTFQDRIYRGLNAKTGEISVEYFDAVPGVLSPILDYSDGKNFYDVFTDLCVNAQSYGMDLFFPMGGYFESAEAFLEAPEKPKRFLSLDPGGNYEKPAGMYLYSDLRGNYGVVGDQPEKMLKYAKDNGIKLSGPAFHVFLHDEISVKSPDDYLSRISMLIAS
jgi:DNA-binding transcriptional MerR regulator